MSGFADQASRFDSSPGCRPSIDQEKAASDTWSDAAFRSGRATRFQTDSRGQDSETSCLEFPAGSEMPGHERSTPFSPPKSSR